MTSLLTKSALDKLPADIRDHIQVVSETGYSITLAMTIGDLERLVGHLDSLEALREQVEGARELEILYCEAVKEKYVAEDAINKAVDGLNAMIVKWEENGTPPMLDDLRGLVESL